MNVTRETTREISVLWAAYWAGRLGRRPAQCADGALLSAGEVCGSGWLAQRARAERGGGGPGAVRGVRAAGCDQLASFDAGRIKGESLRHTARR